MNLFDLERTLFFVIVALLISVCQGLPVIAPRGDVSNSALSQAVVSVSGYFFDYLFATETVKNAAI